MKNILSVIFFLFAQAALSQVNKPVKPSYVFSSDSLMGFDEVAAKNSAIYEGFLGEEFKVRMWSLKRAYINNKYGLIPVSVKYRNSAYTSNFKASLATVCVNEDFEASAAGVITAANQINGWTLSSGINQFPSTSCNMTTSGAPAESELITAPVNGFIDPVIGGVYPIFSVFGNTPNTGNSVNPSITNMYGNNFIRINSSWNNYSIEKLSKTILVTSSNCLFQFAFISVFYTGHNCCDAGAVQINLFNATTNSPITCPNFSVSAPSSQCPAGPDAPVYLDVQTAAPASTVISSLVFNKWKMASIDLSAYIGQNITIDMLASDCTAGGHYGYVYVDAQCSPMTMSFNNSPVSASNTSVVLPTCGANVFTITAPAGLGPYQWSGVSVSAPYNTPSFSNQTFTTNFAGTYTLTMNPIGSCVPLVKVITLSVTSTPAPISVTGNSLICPSGSSSLSVSGANTYTWSTGANSNSIVISPAATTIYTVVGSDANNCETSATPTVFVGPVNLSVSGTNIICMGSSANFTLNGATSYSLNSTACANTINVLPAVNTTYTITGANSTTCSDTQTLSVFINTTCAGVWPGDANSDGVADNLDILELGLHLSQTGAGRSPVSNLWQQYTATNWNGLITNGKNLCHSDCEGNGVIDLNDTVAIFNNYNLTHAVKNNNSSNAAPQLFITPDQTFVAAGQWGSASVYLGDVNNPVSNINGLAFTVNFDNTYIAYDNIYIEYPTSFLNTNNQNLNFRKRIFNDGVIFTATTHTNNSNIGGEGKVAILHFKVSPNLGFDTLFHFNLSAAYQSDANGILTPLAIGSAGSSVIGNSVGLKENNNDNNVLIFPNPTKGLITVKNKIEIKKVEVLNISGQLILSEKAKGNSHQLNIESFAKGVYFIKIYNVNGSVTNKKIVTKD